MLTRNLLVTGQITRGNQSLSFIVYAVVEIIKDMQAFMQVLTFVLFVSMCAFINLETQQQAQRTQGWGLWLDTDASPPSVGATMRRLVSHSDSEGDVEFDSEVEMSEEAFNGPGRAFFTTFRLLFGDFDPETYMPIKNMVRMGWGHWRARIGAAQWGSVFTLLGAHVG